MILTVRKTSKSKPSKRKPCKNVRDKGAAYECEVANRMKPLYPNAKRGIGQARSACEVPDVDETPFWVEAKHRIRVSIRKAFEQGTRERKLNGKRLHQPVLVVSRDNGKPDLATLLFDDFLKMQSELERLRAMFDADEAPRV